MIVSITEEQLYTKLGDFVISISPASTPVIHIPVNRVPAPLPTGPYTSMQELSSHQLATNRHVYDDPYPLDGGSKGVETSMRVHVQFDFYGPTAKDRAQVFVTMWRDDYGCDFLAPECQPLYTDSGRNIPLTNGEEQYEARYCVTAVLQYNPVVTNPQQFAGAAVVTPVEVDTAYPP